jgi:hypothetical protein
MVTAGIITPLCRRKSRVAKVFTSAARIGAVIFLILINRYLSTRTAETQNHTEIHAAVLQAQAGLETD